MAQKERIVLTTHLCPGDLLCLEQAVSSLHDCYPEKYYTLIDCFFPDLFLDHPLLKPGNIGQPLEITSARGRAQPLAEVFLEQLEEKLGKPITLTRSKPQVYLRNGIKSPLIGIKKGSYVVFNAGFKDDYPVKWWPFYHKVVELLHFPMVQTGLRAHQHPRIEQARSLIGFTSLRELGCVVRDAAAVLSGPSLLTHLAHVYDTPAVVILGGSEPPECYPWAHCFSTIGRLECCKNGPCWKARLEKGKDDSPKLNCAICEYPSVGGYAACQTYITPEEIVEKLDELITK